jgi:RNA polymerase sigma factor (sigma-70 family)
MENIVEVVEGVRSSASWNLSRGVNGVTAHYDVDDVLQETAVAVLQGYRNAKWKAARIAKNMSRSHVRAAKRDNAWAHDGRLESRVVDPASALIQAEESQALMQSIALLPKREQIAIRMRYFESATLCEVASVLGVSAPTVAKLLASALKDLKELLGE